MAFTPEQAKEEESKKKNKTNTDLVARLEADIDKVLTKNIGCLNSGAILRIDLTGLRLPEIITELSDKYKGIGWNVKSWKYSVYNEFHKGYDEGYYLRLKQEQQQSPNTKWKGVEIFEIIFSSLP